MTIAKESTVMNALLCRSLVLALLAALPPAWADKATPAPAAFLNQTDRLIVKQRSTASGKVTALGADRLQALGQRAGLSLRPLRSMSGGAEVLRLPRPLSLAEAEAVAARLRADPGVEYAEPDRRMRPLLIPNDPHYSGWQWHLMEPSTWPGGADLPPAWDITTGSAEVVMAVIDTGLRPHMDLDSDIRDGSGRVLPGYDFVSEDAPGVYFTANDGDGRDADPSDPGDWVTTAEAATYDCTATNSTWHGTHVAGTLAAQGNNAIGVAGIDWQARVLPVRVLGKCGGYASDTVDGMRWAAGLAVPDAPTNANPARILNLSLGGTGPCSTTEQNAINEILAAGKVVVVAAGNDNTDAINAAPANCTGVIAVAAVDRRGQRAGYSNYGTTVTLSAPGGDNQVDTMVLSTWNRGTTTPLASPGGDTYAFLQGTSQAAPHVSGILALMLAANPGLGTEQLRQKLVGSARAFPVYGNAWDCTTALCGAGMVDGAAAVRAVSTPPVAAAGNDQVVDPGAAVVLSDAGSSDDGGISAHAWSQSAGTAVTLANAAGASAQFTAPGPAGTLTFRLTVTDDVGLTGSDEVDVHVNNLPPRLNPIGDRTVGVGSTLQLTVSATDPNQVAPSYQASGLPTGASLDPVSGVLRWPDAGPLGAIHSITVSAVDGQDPALTSNETFTLTVVAASSGGGGGGAVDGLTLLLLLAGALLLRGGRPATARR